MLVIIYPTITPRGTHNVINVNQTVFLDLVSAKMPTQTGKYMQKKTY